MKIAITGAHRVGKTTLAEKLQETLSDYVCNAEPYFELEETGHVFSEIPNLDDYLAQFEHSVKQISISESNVIFDRCPVDILAYIQAIGKSETVQLLYHKVQSVMTEIDLLIFVPIEEPDLIICPESELPGLRYQVNEILNDWINDFDIQTIEVTGTILDRQNQAINKILRYTPDIPIEQR